jgi:hypothetical protein
MKVERSSTASRDWKVRRVDLDEILLVCSVKMNVPACFCPCSLISASKLIQERKLLAVQVLHKESRTSHCRYS